MTEPHDELEELLSPTDAPETPGLGEQILLRTEAHIVRAKWLRRVSKTAATAAVFALGVGVGTWRTPREHLVTVRAVETVAVPVPVVVPVQVSAPEPPPPAPTLSASRLELDAEQADDALAAAKLYRRAGDAYLTAQQDYANAARCYRLFLARAGEPALNPEPNDSWLLTSLKNAAFKEKIHATNTDG